MDLRKSSEAMATSTSMELDTSLFPFVYTTFGEKPLADDEVSAFCETVHMLALRGPYFHLIDTTRQRTTLTPKQRLIIADWMGKPEAVARGGHRILDVIVISHPLIRGALTAVYWLRPPAAPTKVVSTAREAIPFFEERARAVGLEFSEAARARLMRG